MPTCDTSLLLQVLTAIQVCCSSSTICSLKRGGRGRREQRGENRIESLLLLTNILSTPFHLVLLSSLISVYPLYLTKSFLQGVTPLPLRDILSLMGVCKSLVLSHFSKDISQSYPFRYDLQSTSSASTPFISLHLYLLIQTTTAIVQIPMVHPSRSGGSFSFLSSA